MKTVNLLKSIRETMRADRIIVPGRRRKNANWPICMTCGREPYAVNLEDVGKNSVEIKVKCCHKALSDIQPTDATFEDSARVDIPVGTERNEHISWALKSIRWFDPTK